MNQTYRNTFWNSRRGEGILERRNNICKIMEVEHGMVLGFWEALEG